MAKIRWNVVEDLIAAREEASRIAWKDPGNPGAKAAYDRVEKLKRSVTREEREAAQDVMEGRNRVSWWSKR